MFEQYAVADAEAFLLERLGDISAALAIHVRQLDAAARHLVASILEGRLPLSSLRAFRSAGRGLPESGGAGEGARTSLSSRKSVSLSADAVPELAAVQVSWRAGKAQGWDWRRAAEADRMCKAFNGIVPPVCVVRQ